MEHTNHLIMGLITGALFGFVLFKVGAVRYSRVEGMLLLRDLKIMKFAFTGIATASIIYGLADILGFSESTNLIPRIMPYLGVAHLIGGVMFGIAMASAGFCPGTCVARVGAGKFISAAGVVGLVLGVIIYNAIQPSLVEAGILGNKQDLTLYGVLGVPYGPLAVAWGVLFLVFALIADWLDPAKKLYQEKTSFNLIKDEWHWAIGGVAAGSIIAWATAQGEYLGFSGALLALVGWISHLIGHPISNVVPQVNETILWHSGLILGVLPGAFFAAIISGRFKFDPVPPAFARVTPIPYVRMVLVFFAGIFLALGALIGGGCTTGAFLAAYPTLSIGSMAMSGTYFIVGVLTANLIYFGRWSRFVEAKKESEEVYD
ncbi:YeeE/YedE thiosulfate transporter family protein [Sulfurihydrogenibium azorense]|uniref:YeeE/YedE thiosulfate transporter family protein n=1 Tax=Sulfurihydrogenibium azorense TaxID=309806 RepID=UPI00240A6182|nr:YeeE/YedE thiosulfate transporter family protein [Sulfurihydrogenibium azorense]MDM7273965.1 YeeE/YedE thiosulfate transporter family protein [Sulfurihydrogenibium azorense]